MSLTTYNELIEAKAVVAPSRGLKSIPALNPGMRPYQRDCTEFLLGIGSGAAFLDTGMGKSLIALEWSRVIAEHTNKPVLMFAPLAVGPQHVREGAKFGIECRQVSEQSELRPGINITNYEKIHRFTPEGIGGVVPDESSIMKSFTGKTTKALRDFASEIPFRLACTATPSPNDHMELGQHAQFLGVMDSSEMLMRWFIPDQSQMGTYRLKKHGRNAFWDWVSSWARCASKPSDLGYCDDGFHLPELVMHKHLAEVDITQDAGDLLFRTPDMSATGMHQEKRKTIAARANCIASCVENEPNEPWIIWCDTDYEADELMACMPYAVEVRGSMRSEEKEARLVAFSEGRERVLITKPRIGGFGLNWQHCARVAFVGLSFSYEMFYQALRRCYRYGQLRPVHCHIAMAETEDAIWLNSRRKQVEHEFMKVEMAAAMRRGQTKAKRSARINTTQSAIVPAWLKGNK
jgi:hypothetical protein